MLAEVLEQEHIPYSQQKILYHRYSIRASGPQEQYLFYVPYAHLTAAREIVEGLFSEAAVEDAIWEAQMENGE